ncbi:MAG: hypothetical protein MZW92_56940 [Comamonadaceae bacterium]|nr:hypothetical protein [Comamonadaceae bacterium]
MLCARQAARRGAPPVHGPTRASCCARSSIVLRGIERAATHPAADARPPTLGARCRRRLESR